MAGKVEPDHVVMGGKTIFKYLKKLYKRVRDAEINECKGDKTSSLAFGMVLSDKVSYISQCQEQSEKLAAFKYSGIKISYIATIKFCSINS